MDGRLRSLDKRTAMKLTSFRIQTRFVAFASLFFRFFVLTIDS